MIEVPQWQLTPNSNRATRIKYKVHRLESIIVTTQKKWKGEYDFLYRIIKQGVNENYLNL